jgi:hypothetical protein
VTSDVTLVVTLQSEKRYAQSARFYWLVMLVTLVTLYSLKPIGTGTDAGLDMNMGAVHVL